MRLSRGGVNLEQVCPLVVDDVLRIIEAASALWLAAVKSIGGGRGGSAGTSRLADFRLRDSVAEAHDHGKLFSANENHSQVWRAAGTSG